MEDRANNCSPTLDASGKRLLGKAVPAWLWEAAELENDANARLLWRPREWPSGMNVRWFAELPLDRPRVKLQAQIVAPPAGLCFEKGTRFSGGLGLPEYLREYEGLVFEVDQFEPAENIGPESLGGPAVVYLISDL